MSWAISFLAALLAGHPLVAGDDEPVFRPEEIPIHGCAVAGTRQLCRLPALAISSDRHYRLETPCNGELRLNGYQLVKDETGYPISGLLSPRGTNSLEVPATCSSLRVLASPRVYIVSAKRSQDCSKLLVLIDNRLDNTSSFSIGAFPSEGPAVVERSGTIAAETRMLVELPLPLGFEKEIAKIELWKASEAIEGNYRYILPVGSTGSMEIRRNKP